MFHYFCAQPYQILERTGTLGHLSAPSKTLGSCLAYPFVSGGPSSWLGWWRESRSQLERSGSGSSLTEICTDRTDNLRQSCWRQPFWSDAASLASLWSLSTHYDSCTALSTLASQRWSICTYLWATFSRSHLSTTGCLRGESRHSRACLRSAQVDTLP